MNFLKEIKNERIRAAIKECSEDYRRILRIVPASFSGHHHPIEDRDVGGLLRHIEKVAWFILEAKREFQLNDEQVDVLLAAAFFHDISVCEITSKTDRCEIIERLDGSKEIIRRFILTRNEEEFKKHPIQSSNIASKYLFKAGVNANTTHKIKSLIECHMSHWYSNCPQPKKFLEYLFCLADYFTTRENVTLACFKEAET